MIASMKTPLTAHLLSEPEPEHRRLLDRLLPPGVEISTGDEVPPNCRLLVGGRPTREQLEGCPDLEAVLIPFAGIPARTRDLLREFPNLRVHNLHHNAAVTAEMAMALLLAAAKQVVPMDRKLRQGHWSGRGKENPALLMDGRTALILGYGRIGSRVGRACAALGMEVVGTRRGLEAPIEVEGVPVHPTGDLTDLLPRAHALVICLPLTDETRGMIGETELALLPKGAVLVNVGRGAVVCEQALYDALVSGRLRGAGIDVWYRYPGHDGKDDDPKSTPPSDLPFGELDNVVLSPHRGGWLHEAEPLRMRHLATLLTAFVRGDTTYNRVNLEAGY